MDNPQQGTPQTSESHLDSNCEVMNNGDDNGRPKTPPVEPVSVVNSRAPTNANNNTSSATSNGRMSQEEHDRLAKQRAGGRTSARSTVSVPGAAVVEPPAGPSRATSSSGTQRRLPEPALATTSSTYSTRSSEPPLPPAPASRRTTSGTTNADQLAKARARGGRAPASTPGVSSESQTAPSSLSAQVSTGRAAPPVSRGLRTAAALAAAAEEPPAPPEPAPVASQEEEHYDNHQQQQQQQQPYATAQAHQQGAYQDEGDDDHDKPDDQDEGSGEGDNFGAVDDGGYIEDAPAVVSPVTVAHNEYATPPSDDNVYYGGGDGGDDIPYYPGAALDTPEGGIEAFVADTVVDATGVAVVMSEEEEEEYEQKRRRKYLCYGGIVLCIVTLSVVIPVVLLVRGDPNYVERTTMAPSGMPTPMPSSAPSTQQFAEYLTSVQQQVMALESVLAADPTLYQDPSSPQYKAARWVADDDAPYWDTEKQLDMTNPIVTQRFALATLYYATGGDNWKLCGRQSTSCGEVEWLSQVDECTWFSVACTQEGRVQQINFPATGNSLRGTLPPELSLLTGLKRFLTPENFIRGNVEGAFEGLTTLEVLAMPINRIQGTIPASILENNPNLGFLDFSDNDLVGEIPPFTAAKMSDLQLRDNTLTGTIPTELGTLSLLQNLELQTNELQGSIPTELYGLTSLTSLSITNNVDMEGSLDTRIQQLSALTSLQLGFTKLGGPLPEQLFLLTALSDMNMENAQFTGTLSENFRLLNASLMDLLLNDNGFTGSIPQAFDVLTALETLQLEGNNLTGSISQAVCDERGLRFQQLATLIVDCEVFCNCCDNCEERKL